MAEQIPQEKTPAFQFGTTEGIRRHPVLELFRKCIDSRAVTRVDDKYFPFKVDEEKLRKAVAELDQMFRNEREEYKQTLTAVEVPPDFDWQAEARRATRDAIKLIFKSKIVNRDVLSEASRSTGPGNVVVVENQDYAFHNSWDWLTYLNRSGKDTSEGLPIPENKNLRDQYVKLEIGTNIVKFSTATYLKIAQELGLSLTLTQALKLDLTREAAHEYAHGIDRVIAQRGTKPALRAQELGFVQLGDVPDYTYSKITGEFFARGFEIIVMREYLIEELGYSVEQASKFINRWQSQLQPRAVSAKKFIELAGQAGYTPNEVIEIQEAIFGMVMDLYGREFALELEGKDVTNVLAYCDSPYTENQLRVLTKV